MSKPERGTKRQCLKCGTKYYDLNKDPIICPSCGAPFVAAMTTTEKVRAKAKPAEKTDEDEVVEVEADVAAAEVGAEVVSLEDAETVVKTKSGEDDDDDDDDTDEVIPDLDDEEEVDDIGGEVDNSFIEDDDEDDDDIEYNVTRDDDD